MPRLRIEGGNGVALAYLETAMKVPVDCLIINKIRVIAKTLQNGYRDYENEETNLY